MKSAAHSMKFKDLPRDYAGLVGVLMPRPIHDHADLENTLEMVDALAGHELTTDQADYLELLASVVHEYESKTRKAPKGSTPLARLKYVMKESGMKTADLGRLLGNSGLATLILQGKRQLSKRHISLLSDRFKVDAGYFL